MFGTLISILYFKYRIYSLKIIEIINIKINLFANTHPRDLIANVSQLQNRIYNYTSTFRLFITSLRNSIVHISQFRSLIVLVKILVKITYQIRNKIRDPNDKCNKKKKRTSRSGRAVTDVIKDSF